MRAVGRKGGGLEGGEREPFQDGCGGGKSIISQLFLKYFFDMIIC